MKTSTALFLLALVSVGFVGIFARSTLFRIACWILSAPLLAAGCFALSQGGIAEPFTEKEMLIFCAFAFWPAVGCLIGQVLASVPKAAR